MILVGERLATSPGALSAAVALAEETGARLAWVPRRAGDRGAIEAGCLPGLLPFGRPIVNADARAEVAAAWGAAIPSGRGRDADAILTDAAAGSIALVVGGVDPDDLGDPELALRALEEAPFVVSLELRDSAVTDRADVVFPVAPVVEKSGIFLDWEGRLRPFDATLESTGALADHRVLHTLAAEMGVDLATPDPKTIDAAIGALGHWTGPRPAPPAHAAPALPTVRPGEAVLSTWHHLLDEGRLQEHEPYLAGTRKDAVVRLSAATAAGLGVAEGGLVTVSTDRGAITLPLAITEVPDQVVWLPTCSPGSHVQTSLGASSGAVVRLAAADASASTAAAPSTSAEES